MSFCQEAPSSMVFAIIKQEQPSKRGIFVAMFFASRRYAPAGRKIWGRLDLTGGVNTYISMQAHGVRALKDSPNT